MMRKMEFENRTEAEEYFERRVDGYYNSDNLFVVEIPESVADYETVEPKKEYVYVYYVNDENKKVYIAKKGLTSNYRAAKKFEKSAGKIKAEKATENGTKKWKTEVAV